MLFLKLELLMETLGQKLHFLVKKITFFGCRILQCLVIKSLDPDPEPVPDPH
jgi:hypothetical protein